MMPNPMAPLSSKGLFFNALAVFLELSDPFTSRPKKFIDSFSKIDAHYWATNDYLHLKDVDKLSQNEIEEYKVEDKENFHFITEVFFITHSLIKLSFKKVMKEYQNTAQNVNASIGAKDMAGVERNLSILFSMEVHMFSKQVQIKLFQFLSYSSIYFWYRNSIDGDAYKEEPLEFLENIDFSQNSDLHPECTHIPEFFSENISKIGMFYRVFKPIVFETHMNLASIMTYCLFIIKTKKVSNPHVRAETLKFIWEFAPKPPENEFRKHEFNLRNWLTHTNVWKKFLMPTLIEAYGDVEKTGSSNQYYEKYHYRLIMSFVFHFLLREKHFKDQINEIAQSEQVVFDKFLHFVIADINEGFQSSVSKLSEIKEYEDAEASNWKDYTEEQKKDMQTKFKENSNVAKWGMQLSRSTLSLWVKIVKEEAWRMNFMSDVNLSSFVEGINYALDSLASRKGLNIKVKNKQEYNFDPKEITIELVLWYAYMSRYEKFIGQVVLDKRSYRQETLLKVLRLIQKSTIPIPADKAEEFEEFVHKCNDAYEENNIRDTYLDDAPDEFIDQLFCILMEDPVLLPSNNVTDLSMIKKHLLNDPTDPYTREPLKIEDVKPLPELKERVRQFKNQKLEEFREAREKGKTQII